MSMGNMALPPGVAFAMQQQDEPSVDVKIRLNVVQLAINSFDAMHEGGPVDLTDDALVSRSVAIFKFVNGEYDSGFDAINENLKQGFYTGPVEDEPVSVEPVADETSTYPSASHLIAPETERPV